MKNITGYKVFDEKYNNLESNTLLSSIDSSNNLGPSKYSFTENIEDSLKFHKSFENSNPQIAQVTGIGNIKTIESEYYDFYNIYVADDLMIDKILAHDEIMDIVTTLSPLRMERFVSLYKLNSEDIKKLKNKYYNVDLALLYFQKQQLDIYKLYYESWYSNEKNEKIKQLIKEL